MGVEKQRYFRNKNRCFIRLLRKYSVQTLAGNAKMKTTQSLLLKCFENNGRGLSTDHCEGLWSSCSQSYEVTERPLHPTRNLKFFYKGMRLYPGFWTLHKELDRRAGGEQGAPRKDSIMSKTLSPESMCPVGSLSSSELTKLWKGNGVGDDTEIIGTALTKSVCFIEDSELRKGFNQKGSLLDLYFQVLLDSSFNYLEAQFSYL